MSLTQKQVTLKLYFNRSNNSFYVQLNDMLFMVRDSIVASIQEKEDVEIRHATDLKDIQLISADDDRK